MKYIMLFMYIVGVFLLNIHPVSAALDWFAYVTNDFESSVTPIDVTTNTVEPSINSHFLPKGVAITPDRSKAYIAADGRVDVINLSTNAIGGIPFSGSFWGVAIPPDGKKAYVTNQNPNEIVIIDVATDSVIDFTIPIPGFSSPTAIAITPDGKKAYVSLQFTDQVIVVDLTTNSVIGSPILVGNRPHWIAITPDGLKAYVCNRRSDSISVISTVTDTVINTMVFGVSFNPSAFDIAITPDGTKAYATFTDTTNQNDPGQIYIIDPLTDTFNPVPILIGSSPRGIAITPDGLKAYVANDDFALSNTITIIDVQTDTVDGTLVGPENRTFELAITPDQAPIANFTATINPVGTPSVFDASSSAPSPLSPANITIVEYAWDFGDGSSVVTNGPITNHTYNTNGVFTVVLTITNSAGTSTTQTFTGRTVSNNGGPSATISKTVSVGPLPPSNLRVIVCKKDCKCIHKLSWTASPSPEVISYNIYQDGKLIGNVPASGPLRFKKCHRCCNKTFEYSVTAVDANGTESEPVTKTVKGCHCKGELEALVESD